MFRQTCTSTEVKATSARVSKPVDTVVCNVSMQCFKHHLSQCVEKSTAMLRSAHQNQEKILGATKTKTQSTHPTGCYSCILLFLVAPPPLLSPPPDIPNPYTTSYPGPLIISFSPVRKRKYTATRCAQALPSQCRCRSTVSVSTPLRSCRCTSNL